jgi:endonuclease-3
MKPIAKILKALRGKYNLSMLGQFKSKYTPFQILISTVLSARAKDTTTIPLAKQLFQKYKTPSDFAKANTKALEKAIYPIGFYRNKTKNIKKLSKILLKKYKGRVPKDFDNLVGLPGVGRKTANCVLVYAFNIPAIPVDVHVHRVSNRIVLVKTKKPEETEEQLQESIPEKYWLDINEVFVTHGQNTCLPRNPKCPSCPIQKHCDYYIKQYKK